MAGASVCRDRGKLKFTKSGRPPTLVHHDWFDFSSHLVTSDYVMATRASLLNRVSSESLHEFDFSAFSSPNAPGRSASN